MINPKNEIIVSLKNVSKTFYLREKNISTFREMLLNFWQKNPRRELRALTDLSFEISSGEVFGIVGRNGSGKSTLLNIIAGIYKPDKGGTVIRKGKFMRVALGLGFDKSLTARENIYINGSLIGLTFKVIGERFQDIIDFAELQDFVDTKLKYYSSGMINRLAFSIATNLEADVLLLDEFFGGVGDRLFQEKSQKIFNEKFLTGKSVVLVTHNMYYIREYCHKALFLEKGEIRYLGDPEIVACEYEKLK
ncbi:ABC transporter ATP-binding protein [Bacteroidota bacterium]